MAAKLCKSCGGPITGSPEASTGRPRVYCSTACKRAAEHEVKRLDRRIELLEGHLSGRRVGWGFPFAAEPLEAEIARLTTRMRELLSD